jgi:hypothetical protein
MRRSGGLRARSKKQEALYRTERRPLNKMLLEDDGPQRCQFPLGCVEKATCLHEFHTRGQGGSITELSNLRLSCGFHNDWAEDNPLEAHRIGWRLLNKAAS